MTHDHVLIIAEAGVNHNGDFETAKKMILTANECGADIVKFQTAKLDSLVSIFADMADYQKKNTGSEKTQKEMLSELLLPYDDFVKLAEYCREVGIGFLSTPFDIDSIHFLDPMQDIWKIPSGEITNYPYLVEIAKTHKDIILSTGMAIPEEIQEALDVLKDNGAGAVTLLHCTTDYPTPIDCVNLNAMHTLHDKFGCEVGYSDHTQGVDVSVAAAAMGATVIEKHFTLDRNMPGPDHKASLEPAELKNLVKKVREIEIIRGSYDKKPTEAELKNRLVARKSIVASCAIKKGEILSENNMTTKRPGTGISPMKWNEVLGTKAKRDFAEDELIEI